MGDTQEAAHDVDTMSIAQAATTLRTTQKRIRYWLTTGDLDMVLIANGQGMAIPVDSIHALQRIQRRGGHQGNAKRNNPTPASGPATKPVLACQPLIDILAEIPDFRLSRGRRYGLSATLTLACTAMLCGCRTYSAIALWGRYYSGDIIHDLGFYQSRIPCALTFCLVLERLGGNDWETRLSQWAAGIFHSLPAQRSTSTEAASSAPGVTPHVEPASMAGVSQPAARTRLPSSPRRLLLPQSVRPRAQAEAAGVRLLGPLGHRLGLHLAHVVPQPRGKPPARTAKPELTAAMDKVLRGVVLDGQLLTIEMLLPEIRGRQPLRQQFE